MSIYPPSTCINRKNCWMIIKLFWIKWFFFKVLYFCSTSLSWFFNSFNSVVLSLLNTKSSSRSSISISITSNKLTIFSIFDPFLTIFWAFGFDDQKFSSEIILLISKSCSFLLSKSKILLSRIYSIFKIYNLIYEFFIHLSIIPHFLYFMPEPQ